ncbi:hypothetical protein ACFL2M_01930 [Patescibacteria group bacterium]
MKVISIAKAALVVVLFVGAFAISTPTALAASTYYADSDTGNDANACTSTSAPCQTVAGVQAKIDALSDPSNATVKLKGIFAEQIVFVGDAGVNYTGLRLTAWDTANKPTIDGTGITSSAVVVEKVNGVTIDYLNVANSKSGIYVVGSSEHPATDVSIKYNTIYDLTHTDSGVTGIEVANLKDSEIRNNTIRDSGLNLTDATGYDYVYGITGDQLRDTKIKNNTIDNLTQVNAATGAANSHSSYVYGIYLWDIQDVKVRGNTVSDTGATETSTLDDATQNTDVWGIYVNTGTDVVVRDNTLNPLTSTVNLTGATTDGTGYVYGLYLSAVNQYAYDQNTVYDNTIKNLTSDVVSTYGSSRVYGASILYSDTLDFYSNTISTLTATTSSTASSLSSFVQGINGPYLSNNVTVRGNTVKTLSASSDYTGADSDSDQDIYGIWAWGSSGSWIKNNKVRGLSVSANNNDAANYDDFGNIYGILVEYESLPTINKNYVNNLDCTYASAGTSGDADCRSYGIYAYAAHDAYIYNNRMYDHDITMGTTDATNDTTVEGRSYGLYISGSNNVYANKNRVYDFTNTVSGDGTNRAELEFYALKFNSDLNGYFDNNSAYNHTNTVGSEGDVQTYGMHIASCHGSTFEDNKVRQITTAMNGDTGDADVTQMYVSNSHPLYLNANVLRNFTSTSNNTLQLYGILFDDDASGVRAHNNIILGKANDDATINAGVKFESKATDGAHFVNNTIAKWRAPLYIEGGQNYRMINNIFFAAGNSSYGLKISPDNVEMDTLDFSYNLYYNSQSSSKYRHIYDVDDAVPVKWGDWKNDDAYGYDANSIKKRPHLTSKGRLKKDSEARNKGTKDYGYKKGRNSYFLLKYDVDQQKRPYPTWAKASKNLVDIGADEYKTKKKNRKS